MSATSATKSVPGRGRQRGGSGRRAVAVLAAVGLLAAVVQAWTYGAWVASGSLQQLRSPVAIPEHVMSAVRLAQITSVVGAVAWLTFVVFDWRRKRALTWPVLWTIAWAGVYWQEPLVNLRRHTFSFNRGFLNLGDWTAHIPLVTRPSAPLPEALILEGLVFLYLLPLLAIAVAAYTRGLRRLLPFTSVVPAMVIAYLMVVAFDAAFELQGIHEGLLRYVEIGGPSISHGRADQWPLFEGFAIGAAWAFPGLLMFLVRMRRPDQATRPSWWAGRRSTGLTVLAAIGATNVVFGLYNAAYIAVMQGTVSTQPPWLR